MSIIHEVAKAIRRNPKINKVIVSQAERTVMSVELQSMSMVACPFCEIQTIMGRPVVTRVKSLLTPL